MLVKIRELLNELGIVYLENSGELWASCPNPKHPDHNPSWSISEDTGRHHCFSCGFEGGPIKLIEKVLGLDRFGAKAWLRDFQSRQVVSESTIIPNIEVSLVSRKVHYNEPMLVQRKFFGVWPKWASEYVLRRGIMPWQVNKFRLGYAVHGRLEGRLVIPVLSKGGEFRSYTARAIYNDLEPRYLNPAKAEGYPTTGLVFGEHTWRSHNVLMLAEGAINAMAIDRVVSENVQIGALMGSSLDRAQVLKLKAFGQVFHLVDNDIAGIKLAKTLKELLGPRYSSVRLKKDADECELEYLKGKVRSWIVGTTK